MSLDSADSAQMPARAIMRSCSTEKPSILCRNRNRLIVGTPSCLGDRLNAILRFGQRKFHRRIPSLFKAIHQESHVGTLAVRTYGDLWFPMVGYGCLIPGRCSGWNRSKSMALYGVLWLAMAK